MKTEFKERLSQLWEIADTLGGFIVNILAGFAVLIFFSAMLETFISQVK